MQTFAPQIEMYDVPDYLWLEPEAAAIAAESHPAMEVVRKSHGMLSRAMFIDALATGQIQIVLMPHDTMALVAWGMCEEGKTLHVLTIFTAMEFADDVIEAVEKAAREAGAKCIMAVSRHGWRDVARRHDFEAHPCLYLKKVLYDSLP